MATTLLPSQRLIHSDEGSFYVVPEKTDSSFLRGLFSGQHASDKRFLELFEKCLCAAYLGDLQQCKQVVAEGYRDFNAEGYGTFPSLNAKQHEGISPLRAAEERGHAHIVRYFHKKMAQTDSDSDDSSSDFEPPVNQSSKTELEALLGSQLESKLTTHTLIERMQAGASEAELSELIDQVEKTENDPENPLDHLSNQRGMKLEKAALKMAQKYPVTAAHLEKALIAEYSQYTVITLYKEALIHDENLDTGKCIYWLLGSEPAYEEEIIAEFIAHASKIDMHCLKAAFDRGFSEEVLEVFIAKVSNLTYEICPYLFPKTLECADPLTHDFFQDKPKPFLIYPTPFSDGLIKKVLDRLVIALGNLVGSVKEELIAYFLEKNAEYKVSAFELEHTLLCGYSEELVLELIERIDPQAKKGWLKETAELRGYSEQVTEKLYDRSCVII